jgi:hypothetical protein
VTRCAWSVALVVAATAGCSGDAPPVPSTLVDGSTARAPPVTLEGVDGPSIATRARVVSHDSVLRNSPAARCAGSAVAPGAVVVERIGVSGASVTLLTSNGRELRGCDASTVRATTGSAWCGHAFARLQAGQLRDPRLSLTCSDAGGEPIGFAWIQPGADASYVVIARTGYDEVYPVSGDAPVRVTTHDVDLADSGAAFAVSEHARDGRRLRTYELEARVSG